LKFGLFLKSCRQKNKLTQEELVTELYIYDELFSGLDTRTLIRWEQGKTQPSPIKQLVIIRYFKQFDNLYFSCLLDDIDENQFCTKTIKNIVKKSKEHVLNLPQNIFSHEDILITHSSNISNKIDMPLSILSGMTSDSFSITKKDFLLWSEQPNNLFLLAEVHQQFMGMFICLRLKQEVFEKIISFNLDVTELTEADFAQGEEKSSLFIVTLFAYNDIIATHLYAHFLVYLIKQQQYIFDVGATPLLEGGKKIVQQMYMQKIKEKQIDKKTVTSYKVSLEDILLSEDVLRAIFTKENCPQE